MPEDAYLGNGNTDGWIGDSADSTAYYADVEYEENLPKSEMSDNDYFVTPSGGKCPWCKDGLSSPFEPEDDEDAEMSLCRGHAAEYAGLSLDAMDLRADNEAYDLL